MRYPSVVPVFVDEKKQKRTKVKMNSDLSSPYVDINRASLGVGPSEDWTYTMRRDMQEIVPGLYLGPYAAAGKKNLSKLEAAGITHVVCVRQEIEKNFIK